MRSGARPPSPQGRKKVWGLGFGVEGLGFRVWGLGSWGLGLGFGV